MDVEEGGIRMFKIWGNAVFLKIWRKKVRFPFDSLSTWFLGEFGARD